jgi:DNA repair protein MmcB-like
MGSFAEQDAKVAVLRFLIDQESFVQGTVLLNEYGANFSGIRADFALLQSDELHGIEIKSEADSLYRVSHQLEGYRRCFSSVTFAIATNLLSKALEILPAFVGILIIDGSQVTRLRSSKLLRRKKLHVIKTLPKRELEKFLKQNSVHIKYHNRNELEVRVERFSSPTIFAFSADYLRRTYGQYSKLFQSYSGEEINYAHIQELSRFKTQRDRVEKLKMKRKEIFRSWGKLLEEKDSSSAFSQPNHHPHLFEPA